MNLASLLLQLCAMTTPPHIGTLKICAPTEEPSLRESMATERESIWSFIDVMSHKDQWTNLTMIHLVNPHVPGLTINWDDFEPTPGNLDVVMRTLAQVYLGIEEIAEYGIETKDYWAWTESLVEYRLLHNVYDIKGFRHW